MGERRVLGDARLGETLDGGGEGLLVVRGGRIEKFCDERSESQEGLG